MQALYVQQEALKIIYECIKSKNLDLKEYSNTWLARTIRNEKIGGHPVDNTEELRCNVLSPDPKEWKITVFDHAKLFDETAKQEYDLISLRDAQSTDVEKILIDLIQFIQAEINNHREKFMHDKLSDLFKGLKICSVINAILRPTDENLMLAKHECESLKRAAESFRNKLMERNEERGRSYDDIEKCIWGTDNMMNYCGLSEDDKLHALLLWDGLEKTFSNLKELAKETDDEYVSIVEPEVSDS